MNVYNGIFWRIFFGIIGILFFVLFFLPLWFLHPLLGTFMTGALALCVWKEYNRTNEPTEGA